MQNADWQQLLQRRRSQITSPRHAFSVDGLSFTAGCDAHALFPEAGYERETPVPPGFTPGRGCAGRRGLIGTRAVGGVWSQMSLRVSPRESRYILPPGWSLGGQQDGKRKAVSFHPVPVSTVPVRSVLMSVLAPGADRTTAGVRWLAETISEIPTGLI